MFDGIGMKYLDAFTKYSSGISDVISIVLIAGFITSTIAGIMLWGIPYMETQRAQARIDSTLYQFSSFDTVIKDCLRQGPGSKRTVGFSIDSGTVQMQSDSTDFIVFYSQTPGFDFNITDFTSSCFDFILEDNSGISAQTTFIFSALSLRNLSNAEQKTQQIQLHDTEHITFTDISFDESIRITIATQDNSDIVIGSILFLTVGSVMYETQSPTQRYRVILQNAGIIQVSDTYGYLYVQPILYHYNDVVTMRILQYQSEQQAISGLARYPFSLEFLDNYLLENKINVNNFVKVLIQKDFSQYWKTYFIEHQNFTAFESQPDILYCLTDYFTLNYSIFTVLLEVKN